MKFVHLHVLSEYSLLESSCNIEKLVKKASEQGYKELAITDIDVMYGVIPFYKTCRKYGIKPIIGITFSFDFDGNRSQDIESHQLILLAENNMGYSNLLKLTSFKQTGKTITNQLLRSYQSGLIAIYMSGPVLDQTNPTNLVHLRSYQQIFSHDRLYMAIKGAGNQTNKQTTYSICREEQIKPVAINTVKYIEENDVIAYECLRSIKIGSNLDINNLNFVGHHHLKNREEIKKLFSGFEEAIYHTEYIADRCNVQIKLGSRILPRFPIKGGEDSNTYLRKVCFDGLKERYSSPSKDIIERLNYELDVIEKMEFSDYFLIVWDLMRYAHQENILTGPGRGSAAGSLVAFVLFITNVDPIKHDLLFERFLNPERISMPDIDIDFPDTKRDRLISYVSEKFGNDHVAQIITFGTLQARAALRDISRVFGLNTKEIDNLSKLIPTRHGITLRSAYNESSQLQQKVNASEKIRLIFKIALTVEGLPRHYSTHAAGVVISDSPLTDVIPIQAGHGKVTLTQYPMDVLEDIGLLKMDFLGLRNLTLLENIVTHIQIGESKGNQILSLLPLDDKKTFSLLSEGDTTGIFQLESSGMRRVLKNLKPNEFEDIVAVNALYRPGPMENIPIYINRKHGKQEVSYLHDDLKPILQKTYGVIVYQEQIMKIASTMASFSLGEADILRRAVSKKEKQTLDKERDRFVDGCLANGYSKEISNKIYDMIVRFANYGFNRSHAVAYSMIAYQLAFLKANYPLYFLSELLTSVIGNDEKIAEYIGEAKIKGIDIIPPSVNSSNFGFFVENSAIRFGLGAIKNIGVQAIREIVNERQKRQFDDFFDFCARVSLRIVNRRVIESLIVSGCFDEFGYDRAQLLATLDIAIEHAELIGDGDGGLFLDDDLIPKPKYVEVSPFEIKDRLRFEKEVLGFYLSEHPLSRFRKYLKANGILYIRDLEMLPLKKHLRIAGHVTKIKVIKTRKGEQMAFLTINDEAGASMEAILFPNEFKIAGNIINKGEDFLISGHLDQRDGQSQFIIKEVTLLQDTIHSYNKEERGIYLRIGRLIQNSGELNNVKKILKAYPGNTPVYLYYESTKKLVRLSDVWAVEATKECMDALRKSLGETNVVYKG